MSLSIFNPTGEVYICRNVGLDNAYTDTFTFTSKGQQEQFFIGKMATHYSRVAPVRIGQPLRIPANANTLYNCDYMMFQNSNYSNKWFYAFITDIAWVNVNECAITYEIDIIQTWYFDFVFPQMFIEREHSSHDIPGDNLIDEGLDLGDMVETSPLTVDYFNGWVYCVWATYDLSSGGSATFRTYGGIFSGLIANFYTSPSQVAGAIQEAVSQGKGDAIVAITMYPNAMLDANNNPTSKIWTNSINPTMDGSASGYVPKNKKLLTYPYRFITLSNQEGNIGTYRIENFNPTPTLANIDVTFKISIDLTPTPTAIAIPQNYMGASNRWDYGVSISNFPQCAWASDVYQAWLAQNSSRLGAGFLNTGIDVITGSIGNLASMLAAPTLGGAIGGMGYGAMNVGASALKSVITTMGAMKDIQVLPPQAHGNQSSYVQITSNAKTFALTVHHCRDEYVKSLDGFFTMFGYKTNQVKTPNIFGRLSWNYVKTVDAHILGQAPAFVSAQMESILDNGIRFWHGDYIGNYSRPNDIVTTPLSIDELNEEPGMNTLYAKFIREEDIANEQA